MLSIINALQGNVKRGWENAAKNLKNIQNPKTFGLGILSI